MISDFTPEDSLRPILLSLLTTVLRQSFHKLQRSQIWLECLLLFGKI